MLVWQLCIASLTNIEITSPITKNFIARESPNRNRTDIASNIPVIDSLREGVALGAFDLTAGSRSTADAIVNLTLGAHTGVNL